MRYGRVPCFFTGVGGPVSGACSRRPRSIPYGNAPQSEFPFAAPFPAQFLSCPPYAPTLRAPVLALTLLTLASCTLSPATPAPSAQTPPQIPRPRRRLRHPARSTNSKKSLMMYVALHHQLPAYPRRPRPARRKTPRLHLPPLPSTLYLPTPPASSPPTDPARPDPLRRHSRPRPQTPGHPPHPAQAGRAPVMDVVLITDDILKAASTHPPPPQLHNPDFQRSAVHRSARSLFSPTSPAAASVLRKSFGISASILTFSPLTGCTSPTARACSVSRPISGRSS